ncbi:jasmonate ZIM domain-containing protein [Marchantia polymorpha subsp. ruderalis]|uniref:CCT domain-containing protein n=1 Tax=Marchantia polymorpha TaxID=3197 RepID=A0A2R6VWU3_MARPO|nr:hypothetical protein MARPO_YB0021 [Marchantia polymorpha]BBN20483.1 hypothetical protein Mp_Vg00300 [Marchantia polymorpha subsp. ruderalis]|eukprot:PTQ26073.1 hypothetical protein MARPO_YB0021 [Marchantia polymorpha]
MSDADHIAQAIHAHHTMHSHTLGHSHGLSIGHSHGHHAQPHDLHHVQQQAQVEAEAQAQAEAQVHESAELVRHGHVHGHNGHAHGLHHGEDNGVGVDDHDDDPGDEEGLDEAEMHSDGAHPGDAPNQLAVRNQGTTQLTLSYQGEVYVFDTVPPEKVQAVLLLLGGREIPPGMSGVNVSGHHHTNKGVSELPARMNMPQRLASLTRFREKRKERCYDKKIRYTVRKEVAQRMQRKKGQFASSRTLGEEGGPVSSWDGSQIPGQQVGTGVGQQEVTAFSETYRKTLHFQEPLSNLICFTSNKLLCGSSSRLLHCSTAWSMCHKTGLNPEWGVSKWNWNCSTIGRANPHLLMVGLQWRQPDGRPNHDGHWLVVNIMPIGSPT